MRSMSLEKVDVARKEVSKAVYHFIKTADGVIIDVFFRQEALFKASRVHLSMCSQG